MAKILWSIRKTRNANLFEQKSFNHNESIIQACNIKGTTEPFNPSIHRQAMAYPADQRRWTTPPIGSFKINMDGAKQNDKAAVRVVIRNRSGRVIIVMAKLVQRLQTV